MCAFDQCTGITPRTMVITRFSSSMLQYRLDESASDFVQVSGHTVTLCYMRRSHKVMSLFQVQVTLRHTSP